jgi:glycosyltransferase involved in cell wall biosynthesis
MDIVVSLAPKAGLIGMFAAWLLRVPQRVHIFQGEVWAARRGPLRWLLKSLDGLTARLATHVLVVSESERCFLEGEGVIPRGKSKVLGAGSICGVDTSRFKPDPHSRERVRARLSIPERAVVCIFLGRLTVDKGVLELAKAFGQCAEQRPNLWLLIAGPDEDQMEGRLRDMVPTHLQSRAITLGYSETPEQLLAASDFLCLPSHREGFGMVVIEAAAVGIPAVGTRIHGIIDAIEDGRTGRLFDVGDVESLSQVISSWYEDPQERRRYAESAFVRVKSEFEQEVVVSRYVNFFKEISGRELR